MMDSTADGRLTGLDNFWLQVEHSRRLMTVSSTWTFKQPLDSSLVHQSLVKLCDMYPRFKMVPMHGTAFRTAVWKIAPGWRPEMNVVHHTLSEPTETALKKYIAAETVKAFQYNKPLWELHAISGLENNQCAFFWKAHHCMSDGQGFIQSLLTTTSLGEAIFSSPSAFRKKTPQDSPRDDDSKTRKYRPSFKQRLPSSYDPKTLLFIFVGWAQALLAWTWWASKQLQLLFHILSHDLRVFLVCLFPFQKRDLSYPALQSYEKEISWSNTISLRDINYVRKAFGGTLNDIMIVVITRCIKHYLEELGARHDDYAKLLIPISMRAANDWRFQNIVSGTWGWFSMGELDTKTLVRQVQQEMQAIKASCMPRFLYTIICQKLLKMFPGVLPPMPIVNLYAAVPHGVFTNIPGPLEPVSFGGQEIQSYHVLPPQSGKGTLAIGLVSYCGKVSITVLADVNTKYPQLTEKLCQRFTKEFDFLLSEASMELSRTPSVTSAPWN
ncbi:uncharacterized protein BYT42DRAFT_159206 [Radiomyces spectabilis]|uniref:uncharacterized protein n=1 Tax=Radiomyces spectabilis TaxID=64574 RepID=UPI00221E9DE0|nr:uncharacterized protein BYT42DRAFT_159206 [Radiomyces spectabilis]KAI8365290.1 hypothetical protein BYT42DRAFT_159206 [Radiomyces spectabilis]